MSITDSYPPFDSFIGSDFSMLYDRDPKDDVHEVHTYIVPELHVSDGYFFQLNLFGMCLSIRRNDF